MNRHLHSTNATHSGAPLGLPALRAACGFTLLAMLLLPAPANAAMFAADGSHSGASGESATQGANQGFGEQEGWGHGSGLATDPGDAPFGDDTIGTLPIHCDDDALAMADILASPSPVFFIEGSSSDILNIITDASETPGASDAAAVYALPGSAPGQWRVYFMGEVELTLDRGRVAAFKHTVQYGLFASQAFGRGRIAYGGPGSGWSRPGNLYALSDHRIPLAQLERNGLLVGAATHVMTLNRSRRSSTSLQDTSAGLAISLKP